MKKLAVVLAGVVAVLAFCASGAKASAFDSPRTGITTNFTPVDISFTVITNGVDKETTNGEARAVGEAKIDNSTLLKIFAHWAGVSSWPDGTKLVIGWDEPWRGRVLVVDKNGTNVLYNTDSTNSNYFYVDFDNELGPESYNYVDKEPGSDTYKEYRYGYIELYDDDVYLPYTYILAYGNITESYTQNWNSEDEDTTWHLKINMKSGEYSGGEMYYMDMAPIQVSGTLRSDGSGKYINFYWSGP